MMEEFKYQFQGKGRVIALKEIARTMLLESEPFLEYEVTDERGERFIGFRRDLQARPISNTEKRLERFVFDDKLKKWKCTKENAHMYLVTDIEETWKVIRMIKQIERMRPARIAVLIDMIQSIGFARFQGFQKMMGAIMVKDYNKASQEIWNSKWRKQVGIRAKRNCLIMETGEYKSYKEAENYNGDAR